MPKRTPPAGTEAVRRRRPICELPSYCCHRARMPADQKGGWVGKVSGWLTGKKKKKKCPLSSLTGKSWRRPRRPQNQRNGTAVHQVVGTDAGRVGALVWCRKGAHHAGNVRRRSRAIPGRDQVLIPRLMGEPDGLAATGSPRPARSGRVACVRPKLVGQEVSGPRIFRDVASVRRTAKTGVGRRACDQGRAANACDLRRGRRIVSTWKREGCATLSLCHAVIRPVITTRRHKRNALRVAGTVQGFIGVGQVGIAGIILTAPKAHVNYITSIILDDLGKASKQLWIVE